jgi:hypothetical protein
MWGARKGEGGERRRDGQKRKGIEGWVKGVQPGIIGPSAVAAACGSVCTASAQRQRAWAKVEAGSCPAAFAGHCGESP